MNNNILNSYLTDTKLALSTQVIPNEEISEKEIEDGIIDFHSVSLHNRKTHSELVAKIAEQLLLKWNNFNQLNENKKEELKSFLYKVCMLHDIGQTSYGHTLADLSNEVLGRFDKNLFFDDNSNNLTFLEMYNLKKILKTLGVSYKENIEKINDIIISKQPHDEYFKSLYSMYKNIKNNEEINSIPLEKIKNFKKDLELENSDLLLDKKLFCYLIKRPYILNRELGITKGLYPYLHQRYNKFFFDMKKEEQNLGMEINKTQLNLTWFMDMSDEIAYMCGDLTNFLNLYENIDNFKTAIDNNYDINIIENIKSEVLKKCDFIFLKDIDKNTDFKMIENKLVQHFIKNIDIKSEIYDNKISNLFNNDETAKFFEEIRKVNYGIFINFMRIKDEKELDEEQSNWFKTKKFLEENLTNILINKKLDKKVLNHISSDLYKELITYNLKEKKYENVAKFYINYLMELNIKQFDKTIKFYYNEVKIEKNENNKKEKKKNLEISI